MYETIKPPFTLRFKEMSKRELKDYFRWFIQSIPERVAVLAKAVRDSQGFADWEPEYSPPSLESLGHWFATQVKTRPKTAEERADIAFLHGYPIIGQDWQLTNHTISVAFDIGMYFSEVLLRNHPSLKWEQPLGSKNFADYGQPVLGGLGSARLNPIRIATVLAYGLADGSETGKGLRELYEIWSGLLQVNS